MSNSFEERIFDKLESFADAFGRLVGITGKSANVKQRQPSMTFKQWLETHDPDYDWRDDYPGNVAGLEDAWNAAAKAAGAEHLVSDEFRARFEGRVPDDEVVSAARQFMDENEKLLKKLED